MTNAACSYCGRKGILIYPVRYAVACPNGKDDVPGLSGNFKIVGAPADISPAKYTLRALRTGYLYTYEEKRKRLKAYIILPNSALWEFPVEYVPTVNPNSMDSCCLDRVSVALSYCIDIEPLPCEMMGNIWIGWSNVLWTKSTISKVPDLNWRKRHMQCIDGQAMMRGTAVHAAKFKEYVSNVPHFSSSQADMRNAFDFSNSPLKRELRLQDAAKSVASVLHEKCPYGGFIVAVNDPVGICTDLSDLTLPTDDAGFDEKCYWGQVSSTLLDYVENAVNSNEREKEAKRISLEKSAERNPTLSTYLRWAKYPKKDSHHNIKGDNVRRPGADWRKFASPEGKSLIDIDKRKKFLSADYEAALQAFQPIATCLDTHHTAWLRSDQLSNWMQGVHDSADIRSGECYRESLAQCISKSAGNQKCAELLKRWLAEGEPSNEKNLYLRALLFNQKEIIDAVEPHLKSSDVPMESIFNIYKRAVELVSNRRELNSFDRLALSTVNVIIAGLARGSSIIARNAVLVGLSLTGGVIIKPSSANANEIRKWITNECQKAGVQFSENHLKTTVAAAKTARLALEEYKNSSASVALELDIDQLHRQGLITPDVVRVVKIPGVEQAKRWISSNSPMEFKLGVVAIVLQMVALSFAMRDLAENDETNRFETRWKAAFGTVTLLSSISETAMATLAVRSTHPLSAFINSHWGITRETALKYVFGARVVGFIAGVAVACLDIWKAFLAFEEENYVKSLFYGVVGVTTIGLSVSVLVGAIGFWWVLVAAVIFALVSPLLNEVALQQWVGRSFFGTGNEKFPNLESELKAYKSAVGG